MSQWNLTSLFNQLNVLVWLIAGMVLYSKLDKPFRWLVMLLLAVLVTEVAAWFLGTRIANNAIAYHIYAPVEYILVSGIFARACSGWFRWFSYYHRVGCVVIVGLSLLNAAFLQPLAVMPSNIIVISQASYTFMSMLYFSILLRQQDARPILSREWFWFTMGTFLFSAFYFFIFGMFNHLLRHEHIPQLLQDILILLNIFQYNFYGLALLMNARKNRMAVMKA